MQVLRPGIEYLVDTSDRTPAAKPVHIMFCHKDIEERFIDGHMHEELLKMLVDRFVYLVNKKSSLSNIRTLQYLRAAYESCQQRNSDKLKRRDGGSGNGLPVQTGG